MDVRAARTAREEVVVAVARIQRPGFPLPAVEAGYLSSRDARDDAHFGLMLRATSFVPWINGLHSSISIDSDRYLDGGLVHRVPFEMVPEGRYDELWVAACSPNGIRELHQELARTNRRERLVLVTPSARLPVERWTMVWARVRQAIEMGRGDMIAAIEETSASDGPVVIGDARESLVEILRS
jgi:hypothetical protein